MKRLFEYMVPVALGLVGGVVGVHWASEDPPETAETASAEKPAQSKRSTTDPALMERLARLERMESNKHDTIAAADAPSVEGADQISRSEASPTPPVLTEDEACAHAEQEFDDRIREHEQRPVDPHWAAEASASFNADITSMGKEHGFELLDMDCRSDSCVAEVEWPNHGAATSTWGTLLHGSYGMNCGKGVLLPEPEDPDSAFQAQVLFECDV